MVDPSVEVFGAVRFTAGCGGSRWVIACSMADDAGNVPAYSTDWSGATGICTGGGEGIGASVPVSACTTHVPHSLQKRACSGTGARQRGHGVTGGRA